MKILNLSNPLREKQVFVPGSRLASYGVVIENKQESQVQQGTGAKATVQKNQKQNKNKINNKKN